MARHQARTTLCAQLSANGLQQRSRGPREDAFIDLSNGHLVTVAANPGWRRRVDILTVLSSFPLFEDRALAFHLDLGSQVRDDAASVPGRWRPAEVGRLIEQHVVPFLDRARSPGDVLDLLLEGEIRPMGAAGARAVVEHGYYLAKWWQLGDRLERLREVADLVPGTERAEMRRAPWGRTQIAEVLWYGHALTPPPHRLPWGLGDQGDPQAEQWFRAVGAEQAQRYGRPVETPSMPLGALRGHGSH